MQNYLHTVNTKSSFFMFFDHTALYNLFQMKPTWCTLLLGIFTWTSLRGLGNCVPIIKKTYCIYATLVLCNIGIFHCETSGYTL